MDRFGGSNGPCQDTGMSHNTKTSKETFLKHDDKCFRQRTPESTSCEHQVSPSVHQCYSKVMDCMREHPLFKLSAANKANKEVACRVADRGGLRSTSGEKRRPHVSSSSRHKGSLKSERRSAWTRHDGVLASHGSENSGDTISRLVLDIRKHPMFKRAAEATGSSTSVETRLPTNNRTKKVDARPMLPRQGVLSKQATPDATCGKLGAHTVFSRLMVDLRTHPKFRWRYSSLMGATDSPSDGDTVVPEGDANGAPGGNTTRARTLRADTRTPCGCNDDASTPHDRTNATCLSPGVRRAIIVANGRCSVPAVTDKPRQHGSTEERLDTPGTGRPNENHARKTTGSRTSSSGHDYSAYDLAAKIMLHEVDARTIDVMVNTPKKLTVKRSSHLEKGSLPCSSRIPIPQKTAHCNYADDTAVGKSPRAESSHCQRSRSKKAATHRDKDKQVSTLSPAKPQSCRPINPKIPEGVGSNVKHLR